MREPCPWNWMPLLRRSIAAVSFSPVIVCIDLSAAVPDHGYDSEHDYAVAPSLILIPIQIMMLLGSMQIPHPLAPPQTAWRLCSMRPCRAAEAHAVQGPPQVSDAVLSLARRFHCCLKHVDIQADFAIGPDLPAAILVDLVISIIFTVRSAGLCVSAYACVHESACACACFRARVWLWMLQSLQSARPGMIGQWRDDGHRSS